MLVRTWHPDRFASDPVGQAAASERLMHINRAYTLLENISSTPAPARPAAPPPEAVRRAPSSTRLSREEIDGIVRAIGTESAVDSALGWFEGLEWPTSPRGLSPASPLHIAIGVVGAAILIAIDIKLGRVAAYTLLFGFALVAGLLSWLEKGRGR